MKKILFALLAVALVSLGTACNNTGSDAKTDAVTTTENRDLTTHELETNTEGDLSDIVDDGIDGVDRAMRGDENPNDAEIHDALR